VPQRQAQAVACEEDSVFDRRRVIAKPAGRQLRSTGAERNKNQGDSVSATCLRK
jgi:hypothetical protein